MNGFLWWDGVPDGGDLFEQRGDVDLTEHVDFFRVTAAKLAEVSAKPVQPTPDSRFDERYADECDKVQLGGPADIAAADDVMRLVNPPKGALVLDVGCGTGGLAQVLAQRGLLVAGLDVNAPAVMRARSRGVAAYVYQGDVLPFGDSVFDLVVSKDALEHTTPFVQESLVREMLRVGKVVVISVSLTGHEHEGKSFKEMDPTHVQTLTREEWVALLHHLGAEAVLSTEISPSPGNKIGVFAAHRRQS